MRATMRDEKKQPAEVAAGPAAESSSRERVMETVPPDLRGQLQPESGGASAEFYEAQLRGGEVPQRRQQGLATSQAAADRCPEQAGTSMAALQDTVMEFYRSLGRARVDACTDIRTELKQDDPVRLEAAALEVALDAALIAVAGPVGRMISASLSSAIMGRGFDAVAGHVSQSAGEVVAKAMSGLGKQAVERAISEVGRDPIDVFVESARSTAALDEYRTLRLARFALDRLSAESLDAVAALECGLALQAKDVADGAVDTFRDALRDAWLSYVARASYGTVRDHDDDLGGRDVLDFDRALDQDGDDAVGVLHITADVNFNTISRVPTVVVGGARVAGANRALLTKLRGRRALAELRLAKVVECQVAPGAVFRICRDDSAGGSSRVASPHPGDVEGWGNGPEQLVEMLSIAGRFTSGRDDRFGGADYIMERVGAVPPKEVLR